MAAATMATAVLSEVGLFGRCCHLAPLRYADRLTSHLFGSQARLLRVSALTAWYPSSRVGHVRSQAPWSEIHEPEAWRAVMLRDLRAGPGNVYWKHVVTDLRWLARRIAPLEVQATAHTDELVEQQERQF